MAKLIRTLRRRPDTGGCVATIGNLDGVHRGHQMLLSALREQAAALRLPLAAVVFEPQPQEYFLGARAPARITHFREKFLLLGKYGVEEVVCLRFDQRLAMLAADAFVADILVRALAVRFLVVGEDFKFGRQRGGDFDLLRALGAKHRFAVERAPTFNVSGKRVSSTWVRQALSSGQMALARELLGRYHSLSGKVIRGKKLGRQMGFPTANVRLNRNAFAPSGIYAAKVYGLNGGAGLPGVAYIAENNPARILEVHIFDFAQDCYGARIRVALVHKLRDDTRFSKPELLRRQIGLDAENARLILAGLLPEKDVL